MSFKSRRYLQPNKTPAASTMFRTDREKYTFKNQFGLKIEIRGFRNFSGETAGGKIQVCRRKMLGRIKRNT